MSQDDRRVDEVLKQLKSGAVLVKQKDNGKRFSRQFFLHEREGFVSYEGSKKIFGKARVYNIHDIDEIRTEFRAETFQRLFRRGTLKPHDKSRAFSILYDNHRKEVHLIAPDAKTRDTWIQGLEYLTQHTNQTLGHLIHEKAWILNFFYAADKNHSGSLSKKECRSLLEKSFNVELPDHLFEQIFAKMDKSNDGELSAEEFIDFFNLLTRREDLYHIMKQYTKDPQKPSIEKIVMRRDELSRFLIDKPREVDTFINDFEMNTEFKQAGLLGIDGFRNMLLSTHFNIIDPPESRGIYQDMTRPLCDYYINTSHNTYLFYNQLMGDSNPEAYNRVLLMGCRAVEMDCYDGDGTGPIVKHAYTLVKPCSFESIIRSIEPNLFKVSPYPVILNIENHCSAKQQRLMAKILKDILGNRLVTKPLHGKNPSILPSPEDLKHKVLIRSKKTSPAGKSPLGDDDDFLFNPTVQPELEELFVYLQNVPFRDNDYAKAHYSCFHSSSLAEDHFYKFVKSDPQSIIQQTNWRLLRSYPDGLRQDSSNPNPVHAWNYGLQLAALNYQNNDEMMALCYGKFLDNGGCGYILKPDYLLNASKREFNPEWPIDVDEPQTFTITIISGQFLPRSNRKTSDIPDPYVQISTHGLSCDTQTQETQVIDNNGFNPIWNETFQFRIRFPQMCLLYVAVMDKDRVFANSRMAYFCAPVTLIKRGYRHIHLRANNNDPIQSTLFVHIDIEEDLSEEQIHTFL